LKKENTKRKRRLDKFALASLNLA